MKARPRLDFKLTLTCISERTLEHTARTVPTRANGQPAIAYYGLDAETGRHKAMAIDVLTVEGALIKEITAFIIPELFPRSGLPPELEP